VRLTHERLTTRRRESLAGRFLHPNNLVV